MGRFSLKKIFYNDRFLKPFSLVAAIFIWFIIVSNISPDYTRNIGSIKITDGIQLMSDRFAGYSVYDSNPAGMSITVSGPRSLIGRLSSDDFIIRPRDVRITKEGFQKTDVDVALAAPDPRIKIIKYNPSTVQLYYAKTLKRQIPVRVALEAPDTANGYRVGTTTAIPSTVTVSGPSSIVSGISFAQAQFSIDGNVNKTVTGQSDLTLFNSANQQTDIKYLQVSASRADITVPILKIMTIPFKINFINAPAGFNMSNIQCSITSPYVNAAAEESVLQNISAITLADVDVRSLGLQNSFKFLIKMPDNVTKIDSMKYDTVSINLLNTGTKTASTSYIAAANLNPGQGVYIKTASLDGVQIFGPTAAIKNVTQVVGLINMADYKDKYGWFKANVDIKIPGVKGAWAKMGYTADVYTYRK